MSITQSDSFIPLPLTPELPLPPSPRGSHHIHAHSTEKRSRRDLLAKQRLPRLHACIANLGALTPCHAMHVRLLELRQRVIIGDVAS